MSATGDRAAGFTLLETLTALALAALVSAIAFPLLDAAMTSAALAQAKSEVLSDLRVARGQALRGGAPVALQVEADGRAYAWSGGPRRPLVAGARLQPPDPPVVFYADGSAAGGGLILYAGRRRAGLAVGPTGAVWETGLLR
jgi:prepilin-type N-terminal cleavage/methylation domain-containing protein